MRKGRAVVMGLDEYNLAPPEIRRAAEQVARYLESKRKERGMMKTRTKTEGGRKVKTIRLKAKIRPEDVRGVPIVRGDPSKKVRRWAVWRSSRNWSGSGSC